MTERCVTAERVVVQVLGGDCHSPIGALAEIEEGEITIRAAIGSTGGNPPILRAWASAGVEHLDSAVGDLLKSLSDQHVETFLGKS
jgi:hydroxymethylbilane synthase